MSAADIDAKLARAVMVFEHTRQNRPMSSDDLLAFLCDYMRNECPLFSERFSEPAHVRALHQFRRASV